ncbi:MAG: class I tRNA ligase family protein, partial [Patescibacteria group bacterium]
MSNIILPRAIILSADFWSLGFVFAKILNMPEKFFITTAIPYTNAEPHIGHLLEFIQADVIARFKKLQGKEVF